MKKKFLPGAALANSVLAVFGGGGVLYLLISFSEGTIVEYYQFFAVYFGIVLGLYYGARYGVSILVTPEYVVGQVLFIRGIKTPLKEIVALEEAKTFGGIITQVQMILEKPDGQRIRRGLSSKELFPRDIFRELVLEIKKQRPGILVPEGLLE